MDLLKWLRPEPVKVTEVEYVVEPHMGRRSIEKIRQLTDQTKYKVGDSLELVAYKQGQQDLLDLIEKQIIGGKI